MQILNSRLETAGKAIVDIAEPKVDELGFSWHDMQFTASLVGDSGGALIVLTGMLGRLYFTIEDRRARENAINAVVRNNGGLGSVYRIGKGGVVEYKSTTRLDQNSKVSDMIAALTLILMEAEPHLQQVRQHLAPLD